ncbi:FecR family protein [Stenotrophomonas maltophilia]|uniref:FecR family protein n=1 Tax=Stenotrophomonas maltophilia TaxID=40324 RepID=UPI001F2C2116|nr:FecR domain-containing protein [Stenotrophomonas maltophilia]
MRAGNGSGYAWPANSCPPLRASRSRRRLSQRWSRRAFLGAAIAAPASLVVVAAIRPPLGLWPSVTAMAADFHTGTGERLQIAPLPQLKIELDTQSSLRRRSDTQGEGFELVQGQAAIETQAGLRLALFAGPGCVIADEGAVRLDVRNTHGQVRVTCLQGSARIEHPQGRLQLQAGQQTQYDERLSGVVAEALASEVSAWTEGMLVFRRAPLREVVDEINRYRRGKVLLGESALARAPVSGRFRIDDPDAALEQLRLTMSLDLRRFPGGIAVLG